MGHFAGNARAKTLAVVGISVAAALGLAAVGNGARAADSKAKTSAADAKQQAAAAAHKAYDSGLKLSANGKHKDAVDQFSAALRAGGLSSEQMAKALYMRGVAYKKLNKPGLAISDLTSALWLKNGLNANDQKSATAERAEAYRMAGLGDGNSGAESVAVADPNTGSAAPPSPPAISSPAPVATAAPVAPPAASQVPAASGDQIVQADGVTRQSPESQKAQEAANARRLAAQTVDSNGIQSVAMQSVIGAPKPAPAAPVPQQVAAAAPAPAPALAPPSVAPPSAPALSAAPVSSETAAPASQSQGGVQGVGTAIGGFFSNLFSGGSSSGSGQADGSASAVTTASTTPAAATSSWSDTTSVATGGASAPKAAQVAAAPVAAKTAAPKMTKGKYKLHIAAVRSRAEAEALAKELQAKGGPVLKSRVPVVDEAVIGSMGTFYRVRVGSYATAEEPRGVCNSLRSSGFDCLVVTK